MTTQSDYTITLSIGAWSRTLHPNDLIAETDDGIPMDNLNASWNLPGRYPAQPSPTTLSFDLFVPNIAAATAPEPVQGEAVSCLLATPDHDPAGPYDALVFEFYGRVGEVSAVPWRDGLKYTVSCVDYTADLANITVGYADWPEENGTARLARLQNYADIAWGTYEAAAIGTPTSGPGKLTPASWPAGLPSPDFCYYGARPASPVSLYQALMDLCSPVWFWTEGVPYPAGGSDLAAEGNISQWLHPIVVQEFSAGAPRFRLAFCGGGGPDDGGMYPYTLFNTGAGTTVLMGDIAPPSSLTAWVDASAIVRRDAFSWHQDKAANVNQVTVTSSTAAVNAVTGESAKAVTSGYPDLIAANGPVNLTVDDVNPPAVGRDVQAELAGLLGDHYDAEARWSIDSVTVRCDAIEGAFGAPAGDLWPRWFPPRLHTRPLDVAPGRFVLVNSIPSKWSLHTAYAYAGRLIGATLNVTRGRVTQTAELATRLPRGSGSLYAYLDPAKPAQVHKPLRWQDLPFITGGPSSWDSLYYNVLWGYLNMTEA